jgi:hypothetical protein
MTPLTEADRQEGRKEMENSLTAAQKVVRRLVFGRRTANSENLQWSAAAGKVVSAKLQLEQSSQEEQSLRNAHFRVSLVYTYPTHDVTGHVLLTDDLAAFTEKLKSLGESGAIFLGILYQLQDPDPKRGGVARGVKPFMMGPESLKRLLAFRDEKGTTFVN